MLWLALAIAATLWTFPLAQSQSRDSARRVPVRFPPSRSTVTLPGQVTGYDVIDYVIPARAQRQLTVRLITPSRFLTMAVYGPNENEICVDTCGDRWSGAISRPGDYIVRVGLSRAEARRNRPARFQLRVTLTSK